MVFPVYTITDVSEMSGRPESSYPTFTDKALQQSMVLFRLATCLSDWPSDPLEAQVAEYAVLALADFFVLQQPNQQVLAGPFQSESIGSYNYSLRTVITKIRAGQPTDVYWFDIAVGQLGVCDATNSVFGGVSGGSMNVFEDEGLFFLDADGTKHLISAKDIDVIHDPYAFDPSF